MSTTEIQTTFPTMDDSYNWIRTKRKLSATTDILEGREYQINNKRNRENVDNFYFVISQRATLNATGVGQRKY